MRQHLRPNGALSCIPPRVKLQSFLRGCLFLCRLIIHQSHAFRINVCIHWRLLRVALLPQPSLCLDLQNGPRWAAPWIWSSSIFGDTHVSDRTHFPECTSGCAGEDVSPTEFERLGGRATTKKWKTSVRVLEENGQVGQTLGDWLSVGSTPVLNLRQVPLVTCQCSSSE